MEHSQSRDRLGWNAALLWTLLWGASFLGGVGGLAGGCSSGETVTLPENPPDVLRTVQYDTVYAESDVDHPPEIQGGKKAVLKEMEPPDGAVQGVDGRVQVQFVVSSKGEATNVEVVRSGYPPYEREARRVVLALDYLPGRHEGTAVPVRMTMPFTFEVGNTRVYSNP